MLRYKAIPTNNTDYSCYMKAVELVNQSYVVHIMPLVINSLGSGHTRTNKHTYRRSQRIDFKKSGEHWPKVLRAWLKNFLTYLHTWQKVI